MVPDRQKARTDGRTDGCTADAKTISIYNYKYGMIFHENRFM